VLRSSPGWSARLALVILALGSARCAGSPGLRAAEQGRYEGVRAMLSADLAHGQLGLTSAVSFARAVAKGEVVRASGEEGVRRIHELRRCANEIDGVLGDRADTRDAVGDAAATVLVDEGLRSAGHYDRWVHQPPGGAEAALRALGARSLTSSGDAELRRRFIADPDEDARRSALRASLAAADPADVEVVLEAARVDPFPAAREQAILAAGAIGGERVVLALKDLWARVDASVRESIVDAWAAKRSFESGGRRELGWVLDTQHGQPAILAAVVLVRAGGPGSGEAAGTLERATKDGPTTDRVLAIELAPLRLPALREAVLAAEADPDEAVAAAAMVRRLEAPVAYGGPDDHSPAREALIAKLLPLATGTGGGSLAARGALARARVKALVPILERDGAAADAKTRYQAGTALVMAGEVPRAAVIAADPDPSVRTIVACAILRDWTRR
jgi:hypothetical protein